MDASIHRQPSNFLSDYGRTLYLIMKSAIFEKAGLMTVEEVAEPTLQADDDVIIKVVRACV